VVDDFIRGWERGCRLSLAIRRVADDRAMGTVEIKRGPQGEVDFSYFVLPNARGRGLASRGVTAFLEWARRELGVRRAVIRCHVGNAASRRVAEKAGFALVLRHELRFARDLMDPDA
jgi:RimJ/RimL family protein N-acetyltransferase